MTLDPKVFKAYDVRGVVPDELDADGAYRIARAYVDHFSPKRIAVGHDMRLSSPELSEAAIRGALDAGCDVDDIGLAGTEMMYYAVGEHGYEGGIAVTASHNPAEYNGMKIVRRGVLPVGGDTGLDKMRTIALAGDFKTPAAPGKRGTFPVLEGFTEKVLSIVDVGAIAPLKVVLDGANGMAGTMLSQVLPRLPIQAIPCYMEPDGTFPHHLPNPLLEENRAFIVGKVREEGADLGIAWDGDADRCFFVDDEGEFVPGDFMTALLAEAALEKHPGATILYDLRASRAVPDTIERCGGRAVAVARRPRLHQGAHARGGRPVRRRGLGPLLLPRLLQRRHRHRARPGAARAGLAQGRLAGEADPSAAREVPHLRRDQHAGARRRAEAAGAEGPVRRRRRGARTSTACRSTSPTGTSTCGPPTPSRCCA